MLALNKTVGADWQLPAHRWVPSNDIDKLKPVSALSTAQARAANGESTMNLKEPRTIAERGMNMKRIHLVAVLVVLVAMGIFAADASAYYNPSMGRFMSRDPGAGSATRIGAGGRAVTGGFIPRDQYHDGMNLYQYVGSNPIIAVDPSGEALVVLSGLGQNCDNGEPVARAVGQAIANRMRRYDASGSADLYVDLLGMGGQGEEDRLVSQWRKYVDRKKKYPCSLEQFVAIGHSDGATAIFRSINAGTFSKDTWSPAYLGLVDLVRLDYGFKQVNTKGSEDPSSHVTLINKPTNTFVENFWQENGAGPRGLWAMWKGRAIDNADSGTNVGLFAQWQSGVKLNHFTLWEYAKLHQNLAKQATDHYEAAVKAEMAGGKPNWSRQQGENW